MTTSKSQKKRFNAQNVRIADKTPTAPVVKAAAPKKLSKAALERQLEQMRRSLCDMIVLEKKAQLSVIAYRDRYQKLRNRLERGLSLWDHITIIFGVSNIVDEIEQEPLP